MSTIYLPVQNYLDDFADYEWNIEVRPNDLMKSRDSIIELENSPTITRTMYTQMRKDWSKVPLLLKEKLAGNKIAKKNLALIEKVTLQYLMSITNSLWLVDSYSNEIMEQKIW